MSCYSSQDVLKLFVLLLLAAGFGIHPVFAETWVKTQSPHFTVISNGTERDARQVTAGFEEIRAVFVSAFPQFRSDSGAETIVLALKDQKTFTDLLPNEKKAAYRIGSLFREGWEKDYAIVRLDFPNQTRSFVYHDYIYKLLGLNFTRMPLWLGQGLAEFFGNTEFRSDEVIVGAPSPRLGSLQGMGLLPLQDILSANNNSPYLRDENKAQMFYAEAWGLTHYLMLGPNMGEGARMTSYLTLLQQKVDSKQAFEQVFGKPEEIQKPLDEYVRRYLLPAMHTNKPLKVDTSTFASSAMSVAETDAMLGGFFNYTGSVDTANRWLTAALAADPQSALAHENMGFLDFRQAKDDEAQKEFDRAASLSPDDYLAVYYQAMLKYHGRADTDSLTKLDAAMARVLQLNPRFAPAFIARSEIYVIQGKLQDAYNATVEAQRLEPDRPGYLTHAAALLLLGHNYTGAVKTASTVLGRWGATDGAEALAVVAEARRLGKIQPTASEEQAATDEMKYAEGTTAIEGIVKSVSCEKSMPMELVLQSEGKDLDFQSTGPHGVGFSDTVWYGVDHFNSCHHIEGMNVVVRYKPSSNQSAKNEISWLEIRDDLIPSSVPLPSN